VSLSNSCMSCYVEVFIVNCFYYFVWYQGHSGLDVTVKYILFDGS
jgi:hypothetical protein